MLHSKVQPVHAVIFLVVVDLLCIIRIVFFFFFFFFSPRQGHYLYFPTRALFSFQSSSSSSSSSPSFLSKLTSRCGSFLSSPVLPSLGLWSCLPEQPDSRPIAGLHRSTRRESPDTTLTPQVPLHPSVAVGILRPPSKGTVPGCLSQLSTHSKKKKVTSLQGPYLITAYSVPHEVLTLRYLTAHQTRLSAAAAAPTRTNFT